MQRVCNATTHGLPSLPYHRRFRVADRPSSRIDEVRSIPRNPLAVVNAVEMSCSSFAHISVSPVIPDA